MYNQVVFYKFEKVETPFSFGVIIVYKQDFVLNVRDFVVIFDLGLKHMIHFIHDSSQ